MADDAVEKVELILLRSILKASEQQSQEIRTLQDSVLRIETHGYHDRLKLHSAKIDETTNRLTILETQGKVFTAGVASAVSALVAFVVSWVKSNP